VVLPFHEEALTFLAPQALTILSRFLPDRTTLSLEAWHVDDAAAEITLFVTATATSVSCPRCHVPTSRVHSRYRRTLADLPWGTYAVHLQLRVRKFFCANAACPRRIFTERLPTIASPWARRTLRLAQHLSALDLALGGQAGARLAAHFRWRTSPDTLLRLVHMAPAPAASAPQVLRRG
jgi:transposase